MQQMDSIDLSPIALVCLLKACAKLKDCYLGRSLHAHIARMSLLESDLFLGSALIDMYIKFDSLHLAQEVFDALLTRNVIIWTSLIAGYVYHGFSDLAIFYLEEMEKNGICPDGVTYISGLKACSNMKDLRKGEKLHAEVIMKGLDRNHYLCGTLVDMYSKCGQLSSAHEVYVTLQAPNEVAFTSLIIGYVENGLPHEALQFFKQIQCGISMDAVTYVCCLRACRDMGSLKEGSELHVRLIKEGLDRNLLVCNTLIDMYAKSGALSEAYSLIVKLSCRNVVSWNALIAGFIEHERGFEAFNFFISMQEEGIIPDDATLSCALKACGLTRKYQEGQKIHTELARRGLAIDTALGNALVGFYAKCGFMDKALEVFESLQTRDVVSWTTLITGYSECESFEEAICCYYQMQNERVPLDMTTFLCTIKACNGLAALDTGQEIHAEIMKKRIKLDPIVGSSLVGMYAECGSLEKAQEVFDKLLSVNVPAYNTLLTGYAQSGNVGKVFSNISMMAQEGLSLNVATFTSILNVCSYTGLLDEAQAWLQCMIVNYGAIPTFVHYSCVIDLLCRAGSVEVAVVVSKMMPFHPSGVVWHDILGSCQQCNHVELGTQTFNYALELNGRDSSIYVGMLNIFSKRNSFKSA
ncbi:hypothetical protein KP509_29G017900 [Ceratopteris richardii]|nr:hypothetical protein KP509_29G017900 [Ceratopteris richardii]